MTTIPHAESVRARAQIGIIRSKLADAANLRFWETQDTASVMRSLMTFRKHGMDLPYGLGVVLSWMSEDESHDCGIAECTRCFPTYDEVLVHSVLGEHGHWVAVAIEGRS